MQSNGPLAQVEPRIDSKGQTEEDQQSRFELICEAGCLCDTIGVYLFVYSAPYIDCIV